MLRNSSPALLHPPLLPFFSGLKNISMDVRFKNPERPLCFHHFASATFAIPISKRRMRFQRFCTACVCVEDAHTSPREKMKRKKEGRQAEKERWRNRFPPAPLPAREKPEYCERERGGGHVGRRKAFKGGGGYDRSERASAVTIVDKRPRRPLIGRSR